MFLERKDERDLPRIPILVFLTSFDVLGFLNNNLLSFLRGPQVYNLNARPSQHSPKILLVNAAP